MVGIYDTLEGLLNIPSPPHATPSHTLGLISVTDYQYSSRVAISVVGDVASPPVAVSLVTGALQ